MRMEPGEVGDLLLPVKTEQKGMIPVENQEPKRTPESYYQELQNSEHGSKEIFNALLTLVKDCIERKDTTEANIFIAFIRKQFPDIIIDISYTHKKKMIEFISEEGLPFFSCVADLETFLKLDRKWFTC